MFIPDQWNKKLSENYEHLHCSFTEELNVIPGTNTGWSALHLACW